MKNEPVKSVRFTALVERSGHPVVVTLWREPEMDKDFMRAVRANRILTIHQTNSGTAKDYGVIGFQKDAQVTYMIFPRKLAPAAGTRVVGIKYDLVAQPATKPGVEARSQRQRAGKPIARARTSAREPSVDPWAPALRSFKVMVRCVATIDVTHIVQAADKREARRKAVEAVQTNDLDFSTSLISLKPIHIERSDVE
jgi:hypothetical protein